MPLKVSFFASRLSQKSGDGYMFDLGETCMRGCACNGLFTFRLRFHEMAMNAFSAPPQKLSGAQPTKREGVRKPTRRLTQPRSPKSRRTPISASKT
jgi:hypothetical protein